MPTSPDPISVIKTAITEHESELSRLNRALGALKPEPKAAKPRTRTVKVRAHTRDGKAVPAFTYEMKVKR